MTMLVEAMQQQVFQKLKPLWGGLSATACCSSCRMRWHRGWVMALCLVRMTWSSPYQQRFMWWALGGPCCTVPPCPCTHPLQLAVIGARQQEGLSWATGCLALAGTRWGSSGGRRRMMITTTTSSSSSSSSCSRTSRSWE